MKCEIRDDKIMRDIMKYRLQLSEFPMYFVVNFCPLSLFPSVTSVEMAFRKEQKEFYQTIFNVAFFHPRYLSDATRATVYVS